MKILSRTLRELRYAFKVFSPYRSRRKVTVFGSARTKPDDPTFLTAIEFGKNLVIDAGDSISITTGSASITMKKDGTIVIKGKDIMIDGSGRISIKASSEVVVKGSKILHN